MTVRPAGRWSAGPRAVAGASRALLTRARTLAKPRTRLRNLAASHMRITNYVAIRFSLRMKEEWLQKAYGDEAGRGAWFAMRAELFKATAVQSLRSQTVQPRRVLVLMDEADAEHWRRHLDLPLPFVPLFIPAERLNDEIAEQVRADRRRHVVISRLDSDDVFGATYLERVNSTVRDARRMGRDVSYVVACNGFVTDLDRVQPVYYNCSPFISVYARRYRGEAVYDIEHERILDRDPLLNTSARWMQVVHGSNIANRLRKTSRFEDGDAREMCLGDVRSVRSSWPSGFSRELLRSVREVREVHQPG